MGTFYMRHPELSVAGGGDRCVVVRPGRAPVVLSPCDARAVARVLEDLHSPRPADEIVGRLGTQALLAMLASACIVGDEDPAKLLAMRDRGEPEARVGHLVLGVTGAIGAVNTLALAHALRRSFARRLDVVLTDAACKIVRPETFRYLGIDAWTDPFAPRGSINVPHIFLSRADLVVVAPTSASSLHKLATGACADLLGLVVAATRARVVLAPSMNEAMWQNPAIAANVATLRDRGFWIIEPTLGVEVGDPDAAPALGPASLDPAAFLPLLAAILD